MPETTEQVAHIEAALRQRFFTLVPKRGRNPSEEWHDVDRLSRALAAYALVGLLQVEDTAAVAALTDGGDDGGIDALYIDKAKNRIVVVQSKFKRAGKAPDQGEVLKTINGVRALQARRFNEFNSAFQSRLDEIEEAIDTPGTVLEIVLVHLGDHVGSHVTNDLNALCSELNGFSERCVWADHGSASVHGWLIGEQTPSTVTAQFTLERWSSILTPRKAVYGQISASELADLVATHGTDLFQRNIRHYLGSVGVNTAIEQTVRRQPGDFFYLNNGLTAIAERITQGQGGSNKCTFQLTNVSIVNGAQTAGSIANAAINGQISPDAKLLVTIIEIGNAGDDIGLRITKARNHQNVVRGVDFAALDPAQERLRQELAGVGVVYHYRPSAEARIRRDDSFMLEEAAVAIASLGFRPVSSDESDERRRRQQPPLVNSVDMVITVKKELSRLWDQDGSLYGRLFDTDLSGFRMCRLVRIYRFLDAILASSESSELGYLRRMYFRHGRPFIMAFVAQECRSLLARPHHELSETDKNELSRSVNRVSEVIYSLALPLTANRGFLAIFRNLTDAQPLANAVIARLAADARQANPPPPAGT